MIKVAFFVNSLIKAGPVNVVYDITSHLDRSIYEPIIFVMRNNVEYRSIADKFFDLKIKVIFLNFSFFKMELFTDNCKKIIEEKLLEENIRIVHTHSYHSTIILGKCDKSIKKIVTFHNICTEDYPRQKGLLLGTYMSFRYLSASCKFDYKVGISNAVSNFYKRKIKDELVFTIYNGVDCRQFIKPTEEQRKIIRQKFGLTNETVYVIVGTLSKLKNVVHIINTIKKINDKTKVFYFVGTGPLLKKCKKLSAEFPNIIFTGYQMDIKDYLIIADFSIAASKSEGFGLAALEAVMSGITLIYSDCKAFKELFAENNILKDYMFSLQDKDSLFIKINQLKKIDNPEKIIAIYKEQFDSKSMAKKYQKIYEESAR